MQTAGNHLVITFNSEGLKLDISQDGNVPGVEEAAADTAKIFLNKARGRKIDFIRVLYTLCCMGFFTAEGGGKVMHKDVFAAMGAALGEDFSDFNQHLSRSLSDSTTLEKHLRVFDEMRNHMEELFNSK